MKLLLRSHLKKYFTMIIQKEWKEFKIMKDEGCPTCGSKNFGNIEMKKDSEGLAIWKKQCYKCKKFWQGTIG